MINGYRYMNKRFFLAALSAVALSLGFTACDDDDDANGDYQLTASVRLDMIGQDIEESISIYGCYANTLGTSMTEESSTVKIAGTDSLDCINKVLSLCSQAHEKLNKESWNDVTGISVIANNTKLYSRKYGSNADNSSDKIEAVDLGLPSGTLWASANLRGYYIFHKGEDDATNELGDDWCMPTKVQFEELCSSDQVEWNWTDKNLQEGRFFPGYTITGKVTGKSIFLPVAGYGYVDNNNGTRNFINNEGAYLSSTDAFPNLDAKVYNTLTSNGATSYARTRVDYILHFKENQISIEISGVPLNTSSFYAYPIRAVHK